MSTERKRSALSYIPGYTNNAVLQLIIFSAVAYVMFAITWAIIMLVYQTDQPFNEHFMPNVALPAIANFKAHWWTLFTYGILHVRNGFMELLSNMLWLYCFGSVVQMLVGKRQIIPLYIYSLLCGGIFYLLAQLLPGALGNCPPLILGPRAGLMGMATAAIVLTPKYRFYLTETFNIPLALVFGVFAALMILASGFYLPVIIMLAGGALTGFGYVRLLRGGYRPGQWMYVTVSKIEGIFTPADDVAWKKHNKKRNEILNKLYEPKNGVSQKRIDDILDKINQKGYNSLSSEEKETLMRAGSQE